MSTDKRFRVVGKNRFSQDAMDAITDKVLDYKPSRKKASLPTADKSPRAEQKESAG